MNLPLSNIIALDEKIPTKASSSLLPDLIQSTIEFLSLFIHTRKHRTTKSRKQVSVCFLQSSLESLKQLEKKRHTTKESFEQILIIMRAKARAHIYTTQIQLRK